MKKTSKKAKRRYLMLTLLIFVFVSYLAMFGFDYYQKIKLNYENKKELENLYHELLAEEEILTSEVTRLQDPDYVAKFAREKHMYSKDGEIIIRIPKDWINSINML